MLLQKGDDDSGEGCNLKSKCGKRCQAGAEREGRHNGGAIGQKLSTGNVANWHLLYESEKLPRVR